MAQTNDSAARSDALVLSGARHVPEQSRTVEHAGPQGSRRTVVIIQKSTEWLVTANSTDTPWRRRTVDEFVPKPMVIAIAVVVLDKRGQRASEVAWA
jgi:hypothetical protein